MKKLLLTSLSILALSTAISGYAAAASATLVYVTVTGTVSSGTDTTGAFGTSGASLAGDAYTAQYEFDTSLGSLQPSADQTALYGGSYDGFTSPSLGASLTINHQSFFIAGTYDAWLEATNWYAYSGTFVEAKDSSSIILHSTVLNTSRFFEAFSFTGNSPNSGAFVNGNTSLSLNMTGFTESLTAPSGWNFSTPTAAPEPASLALLGVGLLGTVVMARRRRQTAD